MCSVRKTTNEIVKIGLAPMFKKHGFKKSGLNFLRRRGTVEHHFNVQLSQWNQGPNGHFYLNAGVMFDDLLRLRGQEPPKSVKYYHCQFRIRMDALDPQLRQIDIDQNTDVPSVAAGLAERIETLFVVPLNTVGSTKDFLATGWVDKVPWEFPAMFHYVLGNKTEARRIIELMARTFADRGCTFQSLAKDMNLVFD